MYDRSTFTEIGLPMSKFALKYSNTIDQNGNIVMPSLSDANLDYNSLYRIMELQDLREYINRYGATNIPYGLTIDLIERILYYRFKGLIYYNDSPEMFQFLPFALNGNIDCYGRYMSCNTLPFIGVSQNEIKNKKTIDYVKNNIEIVYDDLYPSYDEITEYDIIRIEKELTSGSDKGIILNDYSLGLSQMQQPRYSFIRPILASMATCMQIINTAMFACADYNLIQAQTEDEANQLKLVLNNIKNDILKGKRFGALIGTLPMESLRTTNVSNIQDLWETFNSLDNFRKSTAGISNSGVFNKKERMLQQEQQLNGTNADDIYSDGLYQRQRMCDLFNQWYDGQMWYYSKQTPTDVEQANDQNGNGSDMRTEQKEQEQQSND
ncbi:MAG: hypothetical protein R3Y59_06855 [bacterium]